MRVEIGIEGDLIARMEREIAAAETAVTGAVREGARQVQRAWRGQVSASGLGERLARTIRARDYPDKGRSISAASIVFTRSPKLIDAFERGVTIRSKDGFYLAIPTEAAGKRGDGGKRITPGGWERRTGMRLRFVFRPGRPSLLVADDARTRKSGLATRKRGKRRADGMLTGAQTVPIFILLPQVRLKKRLDLQKPVQQVRGRLAGMILERWGKR